jgi:methylglutaconyl-CoA hydratase
MLLVLRDGPVATVRLNRPEVMNAFNAELIAALDQTFAELSRDAAVRAIVLAGSGKHFCAGADVNWMRGAIGFSAEENRADATRMARMFRTLNETPKPVCARVHGHALGGGTGLVAVCDYAIALEGAAFAFSEVKLGILPAVISTFVLPKIGHSWARALFPTGRRFTAEEAERIGLVHEVVPRGSDAAPEEHLDARVKAWTEEVLSAGPAASVEAKRLLFAQEGIDWEAKIERTAEWIARVRTSPEGQEGLRAFLEGRKPSWR